MKLLLNKKIALIFTIVVLLYTGCDLIDPTEVENPDITQEKLFQDATGGAKPLITGLEFAFADAVNRSTYFLEVVSDNYVNVSTYISTQLDNPRLISPNDQYLGDSREIYFRIQTLHALCDFGLSTVLPKDAEATDEDKATTLFYKGMAILLLCENFQAFPLQENGQMIRSETAIKNAIEAFNQSLTLGGNAANIKLALARAYRIDGNKAASVQAANEALALSTNHVFYANYDPINLSNITTGFLVVRPQQDMQPLPRLDFLDPKYSTVNGSDPIPVLKTEEAFLIVAEAALSNGDLTGAKTAMISAVNLVALRGTRTIKDNDQRRNRPNETTLSVKADANSPAIPGLIFKRGGEMVTNYPISGTSLTEARINSLNTLEELFHALYQMRQEIFFTEGRRMSDLGIRLPVMGRQIDANPNVNQGDYGTSVFVPAYIPQGSGLDDFTIDAGAGVVTIANDMNKVLTQNRTSVSPFF